MRIPAEQLRKLDALVVDADRHALAIARATGIDVETVGELLAGSQPTRPAGARAPRGSDQRRRSRQRRATR